MNPVVAIVGRPNVGKSALFNRLLQQRLAIVESEPGVTRDRIYATAEWSGRGFTLVDTGGIEVTADHGIHDLTRRQAQLAIQEADVVLMVVNGREGLLPADQEVAEELRRAGPRQVIVVVNKVDDPAQMKNLYEFYGLGLGLGDPMAVSAAHGLGIGDLLDRILTLLPEGEAEAGDESVNRVAVVGRPNVGKSSLVNAILGEERVIVSDIPGTTRDAIDVGVVRGGSRYIFIDTAGMRRKGRIEHPVERYGVIRALRAVDRADVALILIDAVEGLTEQDKKIAGYVFEAGRASIVVINKWDLFEDKSDEGVKAFVDGVRWGLPFMSYSPILMISARTGQRVPKILETVDRVAGEYSRKIPTPDLNRLLRDAVTVSPPPAERGKRLKIYYATQGGTRPPTFLLFVNDPDLLYYTYRRYLENRLREAYGFDGTPIRLVAKERK
ncbi:MAG TPA: ribosome biogenesis GTPase Der [Bacillota bacterium]|jgi:GTP-binding protein